MALKLSFLGSIANQRRPLTVLLPLFLVLLVATSYFVWQNYRTSTYGAQYIADAGQLRMLSQRLGKASLQGLLGNPAAFKQVRSSRDAFAEILRRLQNGGTVRGVTVPPSPESTRPALQTLARQ